METPNSEPARASVRRAWTAQEDQILQREAEKQLQNGSLRDWKLIATKLPHRTNKDCRKRWSKICGSVNKGPWNCREDKALEEAIAELGPQWISVAKRVGTRHADQCAKRWRHFLDPDLDHSRWEPEDDTRLWAAVLNYGSNWRKVVEEEFPGRSPTNVKNRYAVIKNLRRRGKNPAALAAGDDPAEVVESTTSLSTKATNDGCQGFNSSNSNRSTADPDTPPSLENAVYSAATTDDDFGFLFPDSSRPQTPYSSTGMESLTDANKSTSGFFSDSRHTTLAPSSTMRAQHCNNAITSSTYEHMPDSMDYGSFGLDDFPQMEPGVTKSFGDDEHNKLCWGLQNGFVGDGWMPSPMDMEDLVADTSSSSSVHALGEARKVSLFLEDMQPETANRVTTMLLNGNIDLKIKMTIQ